MFSKHITLTLLCDQDKYDGCGHCEELCESAYDVFEFGANSVTNDEHLSLNELCDLWGFIVATNVWGGDIPFNNCSVAFYSMDTDQNDQLCFREINANWITFSIWRKFRESETIGL
eukprot:3862_1